MSQLTDHHNPVSLLDMIRWGEHYLEQAGLAYGHGTDNPFDEAAWIVLHAVGIAPDVVKVDYARVLTESEIAAAKKWLSERVETRLPTAYLTHQAWFAGLEFYVDPRVLVPRSPLAELILDAFSSVTDPQGITRILDMCTGSGCIAIACAYVFAEADVDAVDLSADALDVAKINVKKHQVEGQVNLVQSDVFDQVPHQPYDLILSNPPYVDASEMQALADEYRHEPSLGLAAGEDGLEIVVEILRQACNYLSEEGLLIVEVGNSAEALEARFPHIPFQWFEFQSGGEGVFMLTAEDLRKHAAQI
ncbi:MAG: 50S ribosomal protein L3 N(5)-glutamine methyltransferase [Gammaproteobacteria bacterium]|nr:50S ribosomal protein L3 N(5)-glutamine methyltransferase [Gammaproteobacteria bacterium]